MVKFGMDNTFVTFEDNYWKYGVLLPGEEKGLTIGGFESAFFADLVAAYILDTSQDIFKNSTYNGIYDDDRIDILEGQKSVKKNLIGLNLFKIELMKNVALTICNSRQKSGSLEHQPVKFYETRV